jgi:hypothetical protein
MMYCPDSTEGHLPSAVYYRYAAQLGFGRRVANIGPLIQDGRNGEEVNINLSAMIIRRTSKSLGSRSIKNWCGHVVVAMED